MLLSNTVTFLSVNNNGSHSERGFLRGLLNLTFVLNSKSKVRQDRCHHSAVIPSTTFTVPPVTSSTDDTRENNDHQLWDTGPSGSKSKLNVIVGLSLLRPLRSWLRWLTCCQSLPQPCRIVAGQQTTCTFIIHAHTYGFGSWERETGSMVGSTLGIKAKVREKVHTAMNNF